MKAFPRIMLTLLLIGASAFSFTVKIVSAKGYWIWVRDTVTGDYGEAVVGTGTALYIARGTRFYRYTPSDNNFVVLAAPPKPDDSAFKTGTALAWDFGDYIYALFGAATGDSRRWFYRYSISLNSWTALANTPVDQGEGNALTWVGEPYNCLFATLGGEQRPTYLMRYDPATNTWNDAPADPPGGMGDGASLVWTGGDSLYALRGEFLETQPLYNFWRYNLTADVWSRLADIPAFPHSGGVGGVGDGGSLLYIGFWMANQSDYIYALSGNQAYPEPIPDNRTYRYRISTNTWERLADLPFGVGDYIGCRLGYAEGHIYAWQGTPSTWAGGGDDLAMYIFPPTITENITLTIGTTGGGTTDPPPGVYTFSYGSYVTVTAFPNAGYSFNYWLLNGEKRVENPITVIMDSNSTLIAYFVDVAPPVIGKPQQWPPPNEVEPDVAVLVDVEVTDGESGVNITILSYTMNDGLTWNNITMELVCYLPCNQWFYIAEIPGTPANTFVRYKIIAYDNAGNHAVEDNVGQYYTYTVIPEFPSTTVPLLLMLTALIATFLLKKRKTKTASLNFPLHS